MHGESFKSGKGDADNKIYLQKRKMILYEETKTIADLVKSAGIVHGDRIFLRYEHDDNVKEVTFKKFSDSCHGPVIIGLN